MMDGRRYGRGSLVASRPRLSPAWQGLPVFVVGAFPAVVAGIWLIDGDRPAEDGTTLVVGLFLIVSGLRFRAGKLGLLPVVAAAMVVDFALRFLGPSTTASWSRPPSRRWR